MFPAKLQQVKEYLNTVDVELSKRYSDGRRNSRDDEDIIIKLLQDKFGKENIIDGKNRFWWDVKIFGYPTNIKTSKFTKNADNLNSFAGVLYAFSTIPEIEIGKQLTSQGFRRKMMGTREVDNGRDYYLLVVNKTNSEVHLNSLKALAHVTANGSNMPLQIVWNKNTVPVKRSHTEAYDFIVRRTIVKGAMAARAKWDDYGKL